MYQSLHRICNPITCGFLFFFSFPSRTLELTVHALVDWSAAQPSAPVAPTSRTQLLFLASRRRRNAARWTVFRVPTNGTLSALYCGVARPAPAWTAQEIGLHGCSASAVSLVRACGSPTILPRRKSSHGAHLVVIVCNNLMMSISHRSDRVQYHGLVSNHIENSI
jgi:hypothetical protein